VKAAASWLVAPVRSVPCLPGLCSGVVTPGSPLASAPCPYPCSLSPGRATAARVWAAGAWSGGCAFLRGAQGHLCGCGGQVCTQTVPWLGTRSVRAPGGIQGLPAGSLRARPVPPPHPRARAAGGHWGSPSPGLRGAPPWGHRRAEAGPGCESGAGAGARRGQGGAGPGQLRAGLVAGPHLKQLPQARVSPRQGLSIPSQGHSWGGG